MARTSARSSATKPAKPSARKAPASIDPSAPGVVLEYVGGRTPRLVPARDLEAVDVARVAYRRAVAHARKTRSLRVRPGEERPAARRPDHATVQQLEELVEELIASGAFTRATQPAPPAPKPEG